MLEHGCLNPAAVLEAKGGLVAAFTNLSNQERRPRPVIKIFEERFHLIRRSVAPQIRTPI